jgi:hypothetical protein
MNRKRSKVSPTKPINTRVLRDFLSGQQYVGVGKKNRDTQDANQIAAFTPSLAFLKQSSPATREPQAPRFKFPNYFPNYPTIVYLYNQVGNYTMGSPFPEYTVPFSDPVSGTSSIVVQALASPKDGLISLAFNGGNFFAGSGYLYATYPMPERWIGGDAVSSQASLYQAYRLPKLVARSGTYVVNGNLSNPCRGAIDNSQETLFNDLQLLPGLINSPGSGLVAASGVFTLTVTTIDENWQIIASISNDVVFLEAAFNRIVPGSGQYSMRNLLGVNWLFNTSSPVSLVVNLSASKQDVALIVEANVRVVGLRAGVNDPGAGFVSSSFQNVGVGSGVSPVNQYFPSPFKLNNIEAILVD